MSSLQNMKPFKAGTYCPEYLHIFKAYNSVWPRVDVEHTVKSAEWNIGEASLSGSLEGQLVKGDRLKEKLEERDSIHAEVVSLKEETSKWGPSAAEKQAGAATSGEEEHLKGRARGDQNAWSASQCFHACRFMKIWQYLWESILKTLSHSKSADKLLSQEHVQIKQHPILKTGKLKICCVAEVTTKSGFYGSLQIFFEKHWLLRLVVIFQETVCQG